MNPAKDIMGTLAKGEKSSAIVMREGGSFVDCISEKNEEMLKTGVPRSRALSPSVVKIRKRGKRGLSRTCTLKSLSSARNIDKNQGGEAQGRRKGNYNQVVRQKQGNLGKTLPMGGLPSPH